MSSESSIAKVLSVVQEILVTVTELSEAVAQMQSAKQGEMPTVTFPLHLNTVEFKFL